MDRKELALQKHYEWRGKVETRVKVPLLTKEDLSLAYTPGVAEPCLAIQARPELSFLLTGRANTVAVITDGTAILGLGDIGPEAGMPVMEGKCALFKTFGGVDAVPLCLGTKDPEEIVRTVKLLQGSFGGINLEDISAPRCFAIERRLKEELDIPVFHDDQHGTAIVVGAAVLNAVKVVGKRLEEMRAVVNGAGAAGTAITKFLLALGVGDVTVCDKNGILCEADSCANDSQQALARLTNRRRRKGSLARAMEGCDLFVGVSAPGVVTKEMVRSMAPGAAVFPLANPVPEISPDEAVEAGAAVVGTGSSRYPNQINNVLVFPGVFRGALDVRARDITLEMMTAAARGIAACVPESGLNARNIIPDAMDPAVHAAVAQAVAQAARQSGVARC